MAEYTAILKTAVRVLMVITDRQQPSDGDVAALRRFAPDHADDELDVLACHVVQRAREMRRQRGTAGAEDAHSAAAAS
jgi:hypothetical protein